MKKLELLLEEVSTARHQFVAAASGLTYEQSQFRPGPDEWSITENAEHLVWAEMGGINGMWKTLEGIRMNKPVWSGQAIHHGLPIETIIEKTWKPKEQVPEIARPRWGGPLAYWLTTLVGCQRLLEEFCEELEGHDPEQIIYPHIISGPLNVVQRLEFLRFHLNRHQGQVERIKAASGFPTT